MNNFTSKQQAFVRCFTGGAICKLLILLAVSLLLLQPADLAAKATSKSAVSTRAAASEPVARAEYNKSNKVLTFIYGAPSDDVDENVTVVKLYNPQTTDKWFDGTDNIFKWSSDIYRNAISVVIDESFKDYNLSTCKQMFMEFSMLSYFSGLENLNTTAVTDMSQMFSSCSSLTSLDLSNLNTPNVTNMYKMFSFCRNLKSIVLSEKFSCEKAKDMSEMFYYCSNLLSVDMSRANIASVTDMNNMFYYCENLTSVDFSDANTANVTDMNNMFYNCCKLSSLKLSDTFTAEKAKDLSYMFYNCKNLPSLDLSHFKTDNATNIDSMFGLCSKLTNLDVSCFNTSKVTNMKYMFAGCRALTKLDLKNFDTSNVTDMSQMFMGLSVTSLDLSSFNTQKVTSMNSMFADCEKLISIDLSSFDSSSVTDMSSMFWMCYELQSLDLSNFNTAAVTNMYDMFNSCRNLPSLDLSNFNTANVTNMQGLFSSCYKLTSLDLTNFNTAKVTNMASMFNYCNNLQNIYVSNLFTTDKATSSNSMFAYASKLSNYSSSKTDKTCAHYNEGGYFKTYFKNGDKQTVLENGNLTVDELTLTDGTDFVAYAPFTATKTSYSRTLKAGTTWGTLCLPFEVSLADQNFRAYTLLSANENVVELQEVKNSIAAGTPVLIKMNEGATSLTVSTDNQDIQPTAQTVTATGDSNYQLVGLYAQKMFDKNDDNSYILKGDKLMNPAKMLSGTTVKAVGTNGFRAYMVDNTQATVGANAFSLGFNSDATGIDSLTQSLNDAAAEYYDLQGHRLSAPQKGINIVKRGGKTTKLIIK